MAIFTTRMLLLLIASSAVISGAASGQQSDIKQAKSAKIPPPPMTFSGQMKAICEDIKKAVSNDPVLKNPGKFTIGQFSSKRSTNVNFGLRIAHVLEVNLKELIASEGDETSFVLSGSYDFLESNSNDNKGLRIVRLRFEFTDSRGVELATFIREVNDHSDIALIAGVTVAYKVNTSSFEDRNKKVEQSIDKPSFGLIDGSKTQITTSDSALYAVEIRKAPKGTPLEPTSVGGHAYVRTAIGDEIEIALYNYDKKNNVSAKIMIDGIEAINAFNEDEKEYFGYTIPPMGEQPGKGVVSGWLRTAKTPEDSTFKFVVNELGKGSKKPKKTKGKIGVITVEFYEPASMIPRAPGQNEIIAGESIDVEYEVRPFVPAPSPTATISIRYNEFVED